MIPRDSVGKQAGSGEGGASPPKQVWGDRVGAISGFLKSIKMLSAYIPKSLSLNGYGTLFRYFSLVQDDLSSGLWRWHRFEGNVNSLILLIFRAPFEGKLNLLIFATPWAQENPKITF